jgi:small subunit ribosomal protein S4
MEKQKAKYTYGVLERQFAKTFEEAARRKGPTGENLLKLLELRLDNTVFRLGFAPSRRAARQMVVHKHITVNGHLLNIPSYEVKMGDVISIRDKSKELDLVLDSLAGGRIKKYPWLSLNSDTLEGQYSEVPNREQIPENIKEQLIVELYSK